MTTAIESGRAAPRPPLWPAKVHGAPVLNFPQDLYIPPHALEVFLETFEGPLDLLLYLIRRADIDVLDIPMAPLTLQYLEYVELMRHKNLELAAEYLVMAAMLMEIKSRMLLPRPHATENEELDPRAELVRRLLEYEQMKRASQELDRLPQRERDFVAVSVWAEQSLVKCLPSVHPADLEAAWRHLLNNARVRRHHRVTRDELSVREVMGVILRMLRQGAFHHFDELFDVTRGVTVLVVNFLAVLELVRECLIVVTQSEPFAPIYVRLVQVDHVE